MWRSRLWSISWLCHQMFYPYVTISAAQAHESDDLHHPMSPFSLFLSAFSGAHIILGYVRPRRIVAVRPPETGEEGASGGASCELRHSKRLCNPQDPWSAQRWLLNFVDLSSLLFMKLTAAVTSGGDLYYMNVTLQRGARAFVPSRD